jgi:hypothetical protein
MTDNKIKNDVKINNGQLIFKCPHCQDDIIVFLNEIFCKIFRHAIFKHNFEQVNPHLSKNECDKLIQNNMIFGCCKPFEIIIENNEYFVIQCDYK